MNIFASIKKTFVIYKIAKRIANPKLPRNYAELMKDDSSKWTERLLDLIEKYDNLQPVLKRYGVTRDDLDKIHTKLIFTGAAQWTKGGHFVAVSALVFPHSLDYCLRMYCQEGVDWSEVSIQLVAYFEEGKVDEVS